MARLIKRGESMKNFLKKTTYVLETIFATLIFIPTIFIVYYIDLILEKREKDGR